MILARARYLRDGNASAAELPEFKTAADIWHRVYSRIDARAIREFMAQNDPALLAVNEAESRLRSLMGWDSFDGACDSCHSPGRCRHNGIRCDDCQAASLSRGDNESERWEATGRSASDVAPIGWDSV